MCRDESNDSINWHRPTYRVPWDGNKISWSFLEFRLTLQPNPRRKSYFRTQTFHEFRNGEHLVSNSVSQSPTRHSEHQRSQVRWWIDQLVFWIDFCRIWIFDFVCWNTFKFQENFAESMSPDVKSDNSRCTIIPGAAANKVCTWGHPSGLQQVFP